MAGRIYVDANIFIYYIDGAPSLKAAAHQTILGHLSAGAMLVTSEVTIGECLRGLRHDDENLIEAFTSVLENPAYLSLVPVTRTVIKRAATLGSLFNLNLVDAIHVATAEASGCDGFLTNDRRIRTPAAISLHPFGP